MNEIEFHDDARRELRHAAGYYERQVAGLGFAFIDEVERTVKIIQQSSGIGSPVWQHYRRIFVRRFLILWFIENHRTRCSSLPLHIIGADQTIGEFALEIAAEVLPNSVRI